MRRFTKEQVEAVVKHLIEIGELFPDEEQQKEDLEEGYELLTELNLDAIPPHHIDILREVYGFYGVEDKFLAELNKFAECFADEEYE